MTEPSNKFSRDVIWNIASLAIAGLCGIALNYLIGLIYDDAALGVFNQVFAIYIFFSQIAVLGVHHSVLQTVAAAPDPIEQGRSASAALALTTALGLVAALCFALVAPFVGDLLASEGVSVGMYWAAPGLFFFALNKVTLACLNGLARMRWYALLQSLRFVLMLAGLCAFLALDVSRAKLPLLLTIAELVVLLLSAWAMRDLFRGMRASDLKARVASHLDFGLKGFMSGVLGDLHSRVDVLMLGYFASDRQVGIYSFAAILAEGFLQLLVVLRVNYAPTCARLLASGATDELRSIIRRGRNLSYAAAVPVAGIAVLGFTYILPAIISDPSIEESAPIFALLLAGMAMSAGYMPFFQILLLARRPGWHTLLMLATITVNVVGNALLIPYAGPVGAALATALAFVVSVIMLRLFVQRLLQLRI